MVGKAVQRQKEPVLPPDSGGTWKLPEGLQLLPIQEGKHSRSYLSFLHATGSIGEPGPMGPWRRCSPEATTGRALGLFTVVVDRKHSLTVLLVFQGGDQEMMSGTDVDHEDVSAPCSEQSTILYNLCVS